MLWGGRRSGTSRHGLIDVESEGDGAAEGGDGDLVATVGEGGGGVRPVAIIVGIDGLGFTADGDFDRFVRR